GAVVEITVAGEAEPVPIKLGVWVSNTKSRKDRLDPDQLAALAKLGMDWAGPPPANRGRPGTACPEARTADRSATAKPPRRVRQGLLRGRHVHL
ncbi:helicase associated domain-containing protein, partial [Streptomyces sundarbansensis]